MTARLEPALFAVVAFGLYLALGWDCFYKVDGIDIVRLLHEGGQHPWHVGYLPALAGFRWLVHAIGLSPGLLELGVWFSAAGAAIGVGFARAGMQRLGMKPVVARLATTLFLLCPGVVLFATVVEFHGPMLAPLGLAFWWAAVQVGKPSWGGMVFLGALCHLPFLLHSQQLFLPVWLLAFFVMKRGLDRRNLALAAVAGAVHGLLVLALPQLLPGFYGHWSNLSAGFAAEASIGRPQSLDYAPQIFWQEWLWPLLPLSVLAFTSLAAKALRREFFAFALGFVPFLYLSVRQLVFEPEYGAYMLPMVLPAAMLAAQRLGTRRWVWAVALIGLYPVFRGGLIEHHLLQRKVDSAFEGMVDEAAGEAAPYVLVGSHRELGSAYARLEPSQFLWVRANAALPREQATPGHFAEVDFFLRQLHGEGKAVLITDSAMGSLEDPRAAMLAEKATLTVPQNDELAGPLFARHLREKFEFVAESPGIWRLVPK